VERLVCCLRRSEASADGQRRHGPPDQARHSAPSIAAVTNALDRISCPADPSAFRVAKLVRGTGSYQRCIS